MLEYNCVEFFTPAHTWTRKIKNGNLEKIIEANEKNLKKNIEYFGKPDLILAEVAYPAGQIALELSKKFNIPYIIREQMSPFPLPSFKHDFKKRLLPPMRSAQAVLAVGRNLRKELEAHNIESLPAINFVDMDFFTAPEKQNNVAPRIFSLGRLVDQKGYDQLIKAMANLTDQPWELRIGGGGALEKSLKKQANKHKISDRVRFLGELDRLEVKQEMQACDFYVLSSRHESFGIVLIEAMACGKPLVYTKCGGITDQLPEEVGLACEISVVSIQKAIDRMLDHYHKYNPLKIRNFVENHYNPERAASQLTRIISD